jgi:hypothetical protein
MPTNVPPQYRKVEDRFREAETAQAKIAALQEMMSIMPKHKGTDHLKAQLRTRLSKLMAELEGPSAGKSGGRTEPFSLPKEGGGRATLIGPTNVGKSLLLNKATGAKTKVGAYALSTQEPVPGMLPYKDIHVQLVDTPPISNPGTQGRLYGLLRSTDVFVVVVDLSLDAMEQVEEVFTSLGEWDFQLLAKGEPSPEDDYWKSKPTILVANKADVHGALDQYQIIEDAYGSRFPVIMASGEEGVGLDDLAEAVFDALQVMRVYTKSPRVKLEDFERVNPLVLPIGSTVIEAASQLHKELGQSLKYAVLWGQSSKFEGQKVGREHPLVDGDVIEIHGS